MNKKELIRTLFPGFRSWLKHNNINTNLWTDHEWGLLSLFVLWEEFQTQLIYSLQQKEAQELEKSLEGVENDDAEGQMKLDFEDEDAPDSEDDNETEEKLSKAVEYIFDKIADHAGEEEDAS